MIATRTGLVNVSFFPCVVFFAVAGCRKPGRESVLPPSITTVSVWTPQCEPCVASPQARPILGPTICYNETNTLTPPPI